MLILVIPPLIKASFNPLIGFDYHAGYRIEIKLICRLTMDRVQALISISSLFDNTYFKMPELNKQQKLIKIFIFFNSIVK